MQSQSHFTLVIRTLQKAHDAAVEAADKFAQHSEAEKQKAETLQNAISILQTNRWIEAPQNLPINQEDTTIYEFITDDKFEQETSSIFTELPAA